MQYLAYFCIYHYILIIMRGGSMNNFQHTQPEKANNTPVSFLTFGIKGKIKTKERCMNAPYRILLKLCNSVLVALLALFGIACSDQNDPVPAEYGTPYASFSIKGKVTDEQNHPVPNVRILVRTPDSSEEWIKADTLYSDQQGAFLFEKADFPVSKYKFIISDTDGEANGGFFANDTTILALNREDYRNGHRWFQGSVDKEIQITLKKYVDPHTSPYVLYTIYGRVTDKDGYPLAGILINTLPSYTFNDANNPYSYPAITDHSGNYSFTYDKATATEHTIQASLYRGWWNWEAYYESSATVNFADIPLSEGKGMLIGKGKKEVNFVLKDKAYK